MGSARKGGLGLGDLHVGRGPRRWPLSYFVIALLVIVVLPQLFYKAKQQAQSLKRRKTIFGDNLHPTPWHLHATESQHRSWQRSFELLQCSYPGWAKRSHPSNKTESSEKCPDYFQWIKRDLSPWERTGITATNIEMAKENAAFKVTILKGRLYVDMYWSCVQTRVPFTIWGMLLLLEKYEGQIPDVEILFDCMDRPQIRKPPEQTDGTWSPAPLFRYCSNKWHYDIPWPDWSFWGWVETEIDPWEQQVEKIMKGSRRKAWRFKDPRAFWRGNPDVASPVRNELLQCNNATRYPKSEIVRQVWGADSHKEKMNSKLENQCTHRYKIYAEGFAWSVSFKYIMACGSPTLVISPKYYDFFMRGLQPGVHYLPVRPADICASHLCTALDWGIRSGERDELKAIRIGEAGFDFVHEQVSMARVYDYMYHMLRSYAALQRFTPALSRTAREVTQKYVLCASKPHERRLLEKSKREVPWSTPPCNFDKGEGNGPRDFLWEDDAHADDGWSSRDCTHVRPTDPWNPKPRKGRGRDRPKQPKVQPKQPEVQPKQPEVQPKQPKVQPKQPNKAQPTGDPSKIDAATKSQAKEDPRAAASDPRRPQESVDKRAQLPYQTQNAYSKENPPVIPEAAKEHPQHDLQKEAPVVPNKEKSNHDERSLASDSSPNSKNEQQPARPNDGIETRKTNPGDDAKREIQKGKERPDEVVKTSKGATSGGEKELEARQERELEDGKQSGSIPAWVETRRPEILLVPERPVV